MKKITSLTTILFLAFTVSVFAQGGRFRQKMEQVKSLKVAFITSELNLTSEESAKFWPIYNAFEDKQRALRKEKINGFRDRHDDSGPDNLSEKEANALLLKMEDNEEEMHQLRKKFILDLKEVLPAAKILKLKKAEEDFNKKLLQQYREKRGKR